MGREQIAPATLSEKPNAFFGDTPPIDGLSEILVPVMGTRGAVKTSAVLSEPGGAYAIESKEAWKH